MPSLTVCHAWVGIPGRPAFSEGKERSRSWEEERRDEREQKEWRENWPRCIENKE